MKVSVALLLLFGLTFARAEVVEGKFLYSTSFMVVFESRVEHYVWIRNWSNHSISYNNMSILLIQLTKLRFLIYGMLCFESAADRTLTSFS